MNVCARPVCTNEMPPRTNKRGRPRKYCNQLCSYLEDLEQRAEAMASRRGAEFTDSDREYLLVDLGLGDADGLDGYSVGLASDWQGERMPDCENAVEGWVTIGSMDIVRWTPEEKAAHEARAESFGRQSLPWEEPKHTPHYWAVAEAQATNEEAA